MWSSPSPVIPWQLGWNNKGQIFRIILILSFPLLFYHKVLLMLHSEPLQAAIVSSEDYWNTPSVVNPQYSGIVSSPFSMLLSAGAFKQFITTIFSQFKNLQWSSSLLNSVLHDLLPTNISKLVLYLQPWNYFFTFVHLSNPASLTSNLFICVYVYIYTYIYLYVCVDIYVYMFFLVFYFKIVKLFKQRKKLQK